MPPSGGVTCNEIPASRDGREGGKHCHPSVLHPSVFVVARGEVAAGRLCRAVEVPLWVGGAGRGVGVGAEWVPTAAPAAALRGV